MSLMPEAKPIPGDPEGGMMVNAAMMIEIARRAGTPQAAAFLEAYREASARIARREPLLSAERLQGRAVVAAWKDLGADITLTRGRP